MKKLLYTSILVALLIGACKPKDKEEPKATASIILNAVHSYLQYQNRPNTFYKGDTLRYDIVVSSEKDVTNLNVTVNGASKLSKSSFSSATSFTERFTYIIEEDPGANVTINVSVKESTDKESSSKISFVVSDLKVYNNLKIYNKATVAFADSCEWYFKFAPKSPGLAYVDEEISDFSIGNAPGISYLSLLRQTPNSFEPADYSETFFSRIESIYDPTGYQCRFMKSNSPYSSFTTPNQIVSYFSNNPGLITGTVESISGVYVDPVAVGDVYILEFDQLSALGGPETFFVFKITDIIDDGKTSTTGGHDNDYIKFDLKFFCTNRF